MGIRMLQLCSRVLMGGALVLAPSLAWAVNCCQLGTGPCNIIPPMVHGVSPGWTGPICGTTISGTNCTARLDTDGSASSGDCITLGSGVTLDLNGFALDCTSGSCGTAILNTNSGSGSAAVVIKNGDITRAWTTGILETGGTNTSVTEIHVEGAATGIADVRGTIDHTVVRDASTLGIDLYPGEDLNSVVLRNNGNSAANGYGMLLTGSVASSSLDNVLFIDNRVHIHWDHATGVPSMQRSEFQNAVTCGCYMESGFGNFCNPANSCVDITNSTTPTIEEDIFYP